MIILGAMNAVATYICDLLQTRTIQTQRCTNVYMIVC